MMRLQKFVFLCLIFSFGTFLLYAQKTGVMIMAHGGSAEWDNLVKEAAQPLEKDYPVAFAWGMADSKTLQAAIDELEAKGITKIIAVPLFISSYSPIIRQTEYLLGKRDSLADAPMPIMDHSGGSSSGHMHMHMPKKSEVKPLKVKAEVVLTHALDDHDVVAQILYDRVSDLSTSPENETVILAAHGPNKEADNKHWVTNLESLSQKIQRIQEEKGNGFKQIFAVTVRDDASEAIFNQAKEQLRALVRQANNFGKVIVVPVFLSSGGREQAVAERLQGLNFNWSGKTLLPDNRLSDFLMSSVNRAIAGDSASL